MKIKLLSSFIILVLLTVGIMGFFSMDIMNYNNQSPCPFSIVSGGDCSLLNNSFMALHHLSGVEYFSQVIINGSFNFLILFVVSISFLSILLIKLIQNTLLNDLFKKIYIAKIKSRDRKQFLRWLSLVNNKDFSVSNRMHCII